MNGTGYSRKYGGIDHCLHCGWGDQGESNKRSTNKAADKFVYVGNSSDPLTTSLYIPINDKLVNIHWNSIIQPVFASEKAMTSHGSDNKKNREANLTVLGDSSNLDFIEVLQRDKGLLDPNIEEIRKLKSFFAEQRQI